MPFLRRLDQGGKRLLGREPVPLHQDPDGLPDHRPALHGLL
jgi:hypothetical protein